MIVLIRWARSAFVDRTRRYFLRGASSGGRYGMAGRLVRMRNSAVMGIRFMGDPALAIHALGLLVLSCSPQGTLIASYAAKVHIVVPQLWHAQPSVAFL